MRYAKRLYKTVFFLLGVIGIGGLTDDLTTWRDWLQRAWALMIENDVVNWTLVAIAVVGFVSPEIRDGYRSYRKRKLRSTVEKDHIKFLQRTVEMYKSGLLKPSDEDRNRIPRSPRPPSE